MGARRSSAESVRPQRRIIDSNFLRSPKLTAYLSKSTANQIVLTEFVLMEQHKASNPAHTVRAALALCSQFPRQVLTLKRSPEIMRLSTRSSGLQKRMIDERATATFPAYCAALSDPSKRTQVEALIAKRGAESARHMAIITAECAYIPEIFGRISTEFTGGELLEIRQRRPFRENTQRKLLDAMFEESRRLYLAAGIEKQYWPKLIQDALNAFPFRYAVCVLLLYMRWVRDGEPKRAPQKLRNDVVDANTAAFGTYFDGVLSGDGKLQGIYREARFLIGELGGYVGQGR